MSRSSSAVVDSKVVEMSLDNQNFEKNAEVSISTIKKLQEALKFSNSTDSLDKINASVKKVNFNPIVSGVEQAKSSFSALEAVAFGAFANIGKKIENYAEKVALAIPRQIVEGGKSRAFNMEQAKFMIDGLAEQTGATFDKVEKSIENAVTGTAYGFDEAATAASQLLASSVQVGEQMDHALLAISGVSAMTGSSYSEIAHIFTTIAGNGKVMTEQLNQFSVRGLNAAASLADQLGVTEEEIREMVHKGQIDFQTFADAMDSAFGKHAKDANKTFSGSFANIKAVFSRMGQKFIGPGMESMTKVFNHLLPLLKEIEVRVAGIAERVMPFFDKLADGVSGAIDTIYTALTGKDPVKEAADSASEATEQTLSDIENIRKTAIDVIRGDYGNGMERVNKLTEAGFNAEQVQDYVNKVHELTGGTWDLNDAILAQTDAYFGDYQALAKLSDDDLKAAGMSDEDIANLRESAKALEEVAENAELTANEMAEMDVRTRFVTGLQNMLKGLSTIFGDIGDVIVGKFAGLSISDFNPIEFLSIKFLELSQRFTAFASEHSDDIAGIFNGIMSAGMALWKVLGFVGRAMWTIVSTVLGVFGLGILEVAGWIGNLIGKIHDWFTQNQILEKSLKWIRDTVEKVTTKPQHFEGTKKAFAEFKDRVKEMGGFKLENVVNIFKDFKQNVLGQFLDFEPFKKIKEGVIQMRDTVKAKFDEMSYDAEGNETTFGKVYHAIANGFDWITDKVGKAKEKIANWWEQYDIGAFLSKQWANFSEGLSQLGSNLVTFFQGLPGVIGDFWNQVLANGGFSFDNLSSIFDIFKNTIGKYFSDFKGFEGLKAAFATLKDDAKAKLAEMGINIDDIKNKIIEWKDKVVETIKGIPAAIADFSLPDALQKFLDFLTGGDTKTAQEGAEGVAKSVEDMNQTITSTMDQKFMASAMPVISFFSEEVAAEIQENADSMDETTKGFFGNTLGHYLPGIAALLDKVFGDFGTMFLNVFENMSKAFGELEPGWIWDVIHALMGFAGLIVLGKVAGAVAQFVSAFSAEKKANAKDINANAWLKKAAAIAIVAAVIYGLAQMEVGDLIKGGIVVGIIIGALVGIDVAMSKLPPKSNRHASGILDMAKGIATIAVVAIVLSLIDFWQLMEGLGKLGIILAVMLGVEFALSRMKKANTKGIEEFARAAGILAAITVIMGLIPWDVFWSGLKKLIIICALILVVLGIISKFANNLKKAKGVMKDLAILIGVMAVAFLVLSFLSWGQILKGFVALGAVAAIAIGTLAAIALINNKLGPAQSSIRGLALLFAVMAGSLIAVSLIDPDKLWPAVGAITIMSLLVVMLTAVASKCDPGIKTIGKMALLLGMMIVALAIIDHFDIEAKFETIASLSLLMVAVAAAMILIGIASKAAVGISASIPELAIAFVAVLVVLGVIGLIAALLGHFGGEGLMKDIQTGIDIIGTIINGLVSLITGAIQTALNALPAMADSIVAFVDHLSKINDVPLPDFGKCLIAFEYFLGAEIMGAIAGVLDWLLGDQMSAGLARLPGMADSIVEFMSHLSALNDVKVPGLGRFGMTILAFLGTEIMGAISGALEMIMGDQMSTGLARLPGMADSLVEFMTALGALNNVKSVSLGKFASTIGAFVGTEIMGAISAALETIMGDQMSAGLARLPGMARKMVTFYTELTALNDLPYVSFGRFASLIGAVAAADFTGLFTAIGDEIVEGISGEEGKGMMDTFTEDLGALAGAITEWAATMETLNGVTIDMTPIQNAIDAVSSANDAGLMSSLESALTSFFTGEQKSAMEQFKEDLGVFGTAISEFETQFGDVKVEIDKEGITDLTTSLNEVKGVEGGGLVGAIADFFGGDVTSKLESFAEQVPLLGDAIMAFNNSLGEEINPEALTAASQAAKNIGEFAASVSGYVMGTEFTALSGYLSEDLGPALNTFVGSIESLGDLTTLGDSLTNISSSISTLNGMTLNEGDIIDAVFDDQWPYRS